MLEDKDRIFKNLYNDYGPDLKSAKDRGDWIDTKSLCEKGRDWIITEIKDSTIKRQRWGWFPNWIKMVFCSKKARF